ncbi:MAG: hypothetical protein CM15mP84_02540 [Cellvibrionales bacterium]|nr:MAG: hypothetical protein CM15mP84_02540 [Cellvibrionales bacterium]
MTNLLKHMCADHDDKHGVRQGEMTPPTRPLRWQRWKASSRHFLLSTTQPFMDEWITDDFLIFEMGEVFTWASFQAFLAGAGYADWISTDWQFSEYRVSVSGQAAHISYVNEGGFIYRIRET